MTGTTELSAEQAKVVGGIVSTYESRGYTVCRLVIIPRLSSYGEAVTVKVVSLNEGYEGPLEDLRVVYRDGEIVTVAEADRRAKLAATS